MRDEMTQLYQMLNGATKQSQQMPYQQAPKQNVNMMQRFGEFVQAMKNPAVFVKKCFSDIPDEISNDPNKILNYLKQTRGITDQQIQDCMSNGASIMQAFSALKGR